MKAPVSLLPKQHRNILMCEKRYGKFADDLINAYPVDGDKVVKTTRIWPVMQHLDGTRIWASLQSKPAGRKCIIIISISILIIPPIHQSMVMAHRMGRRAYVFNHLNASDPQISKPIMTFADAMATYWTNFAKYGNPNGNGVPQWSAFSNKIQWSCISAKHHIPAPCPVKDR